MKRDPNGNGYDKAEQLIGEALAEYAKAEPRSGFEGRVLVRLRAAQEQPQWNVGWRWVFAIGTAAMFLLALLWLARPNSRQVPEASITKSAPNTKEPAVKVSEEAQPLKQERTLAKARVRRNSLPRQEQFPSALPLNDQERMLARYVQDFPEKAALVARAQTDLYKLNELEMNKSQAAVDSNHSDSPE